MATMTVEGLLATITARTEGLALKRKELGELRKLGDETRRRVLEEDTRRRQRPTREEACEDFLDARERLFEIEREGGEDAHLIARAFGAHGARFTQHEDDQIMEHVDYCLEKNSEISWLPLEEKMPGRTVLQLIGRYGILRLRDAEPFDADEDAIIIHDVRRHIVSGRKPDWYALKARLPGHPSCALLRSHYNSRLREKVFLSLRGFVPQLNCMPAPFPLRLYNFVQKHATPDGTVSWNDDGDGGFIIRDRARFERLLPELGLRTTDFLRNLRRAAFARKGRGSQRCVFPGTFTHEFFRHSQPGLLHGVVQMSGGRDMWLDEGRRPRDADLITLLQYVAGHPISPALLSHALDELGFPRHVVSSCAQGHPLPPSLVADVGAAARQAVVAARDPFDCPLARAKLDGIGSKSVALLAANNVHTVRELATINEASSCFNDGGRHGFGRLFDWRWKSEALLYLERGDAATSPAAAPKSR